MSCNMDLLELVKNSFRNDETMPGLPHATEKGQWVQNSYHESVATRTSWHNFKNSKQRGRAMKTGDGLRKRGV